MRSAGLLSLVLGCVVATVCLLAGADKERAEAIRKERQKYAGTWRVIFLEVDGTKTPDKDAAKITVGNRADGTWSVVVDGKEISKGTSGIDPTTKPKKIDLKPTDGTNKGRVLRGIYEVKVNCRKVCFAPAGKERPTEFSSKPGSRHVLAIFKREKP
jgi:uncharacterized protein (TIGR03067 family)